MTALPQITEGEFQDQVIRLARLFGWRVAHFRAARTLAGWTTPVAADGKGWPDLVLVHAGRQLCLFRELKRDDASPSPEQVRWLNDLEEAGLDAGVWRPGDWALIERTLKGETNARVA